jgi:hypothetical protein
LAAPWLTYEGAIERIDEIPGEPGIAQKTVRRLTRLQLRIKRPAPPGEIGGLSVFMLDLYNGGVHGEPGDSVRFSYAGRLPVNRELWFGWLNGYRIVHRAAPGFE